jgi:hypothetical protein
MTETTIVIMLLTSGAAVCAMVYFMVIAFTRKLIKLKIRHHGRVGDDAVDFDIEVEAWDADEVSHVLGIVRRFRKAEGQK